MNYLNKLSETACKLLFSRNKETYIAFCDESMLDYLNWKELTVRKQFALMTGILTISKCYSGTDTSTTYIKKCLQEFLTAYHIACNPHLIDYVLCGFLRSHHGASICVLQVFKFLCDLNISSANKLSVLLNERIVHKEELYLGLLGHTNHQDSIVSGYREAVLNGYTNVSFLLSHVLINDTI
ncbi:hypothetical protein DPMN_037870 [Dreissena polymorpha]|uniref:Uncharacterized protein n=1 Tax=Dreissena polymorpha TaxID=45954 RepID=A0A9D4RQ66_DREPO|nr:hypothetical protein DPMN_037870 [Dreissena polymorpha]